MDAEAVGCVFTHYIYVWLMNVDVHMYVLRMYVCRRVFDTCTYTQCLPVAHAPLPCGHAEQSSLALTKALRACLRLSSNRLPASFVDALSLSTTSESLEHHALQLRYTAAHKYLCRCMDSRSLLLPPQRSACPRQLERTARNTCAALTANTGS